LAAAFIVPVRGSTDLKRALLSTSEPGLLSYLAGGLVLGLASALANGVVLPLVDGRPLFPGGIGFALLLVALVTAAGLLAGVVAQRISTVAFGGPAREDARTWARIEAILPQGQGTKVREGLTRSLDGRVQVRCMLQDIADSVLGPHAHIDVIDIATGLVERSFIARLQGVKATPVKPRRRSVARWPAGGAQPVVRFWLGLPTDMLAPESGAASLPAADSILLEEFSDGVLVRRIGPNDCPGGDTWHDSHVNAYAQIESEHAQSKTLQWEDV
jgi:hypothetical protein